MAGTIGGKVALDGEKQFKQAIGDINQEFRVMKAELGAVSTAFSKNNKTVGDAKRENEALGQAVNKLKERLSAQEEGLKNAQREYGETDKRTLKWKETIANTQKEINQYTNKIDDNVSAIEDAGKGSKKLGDETKLYANEAVDATKKTSIFGDVLKANLASEAIIGGVKALGGAIKSLGSGMVGMIKQSVEGFAEYQQLVGGVETLFKESADEVQGYANNAYKSSGLNANQYMETVTSFSASLLQSLNGDTSKSAKVADMAIIDMADNANKMGSSMESIQNAYQGFAKQNYTMLDNLRLGYGGTKGEMERLLADASKLSGTKYDITNLSDVYSAINVVQTQLGITGTTAKEASQTIAGSLSATKSAWSNLVNSLGDENANLGELTSLVIDSAMTALDNLIPVVEQVVYGIIDALPLITKKIMELLPGAIAYITEQLPMFLDSGIDLVLTLISGLMEAMPQLMDTAMLLIQEMLTTFLFLLPDIIQMGIDMLLALIDGIVEAIPELIPVMVNTVLTIVDALIDNIDKIVEGGIKLILALAQGLIKAIPRLIEKAPEIIRKLAQAFMDNLPKILQAGWDLLLELGKGIANYVPELVKLVLGIPGKLVNVFINTDWVKVGKDILGGIGSGITNAVGGLVKSAKEAAGKLLDGVKGFFGIRSPSRKMRDEVGVMLAEGLGIGFEDEMKDISKDMIKAVPTDFETNSTVNFNASKQSDIGRLIQLTEELLNKPTYIILDSGQLVGGIGDKVDKFLANKLKLSTRGV